MKQLVTATGVYTDVQHRPVAPNVARIIAEIVYASAQFAFVTKYKMPAPPNIKKARKDQLSFLAFYLYRIHRNDAVLLLIIYARKPT